MLVDNALYETSITNYNIVWYLFSDQTSIDLDLMASRFLYCLVFTRILRINLALLRGVRYQLTLIQRTFWLQPGLTRILSIVVSLPTFLFSTSELPSEFQIPFRFGSAKVTFVSLFANSFLLFLILFFQSLLLFYFPAPSSLRASNVVSHTVSTKSYLQFFYCCPSWWLLLCIVMSFGNLSIQVSDLIPGVNQFSVVLVQLIWFLFHK